MDNKKTDITFLEYSKKASSTAIYDGRGTLMGLVYASLGLGECGELQGKVKKIIRDNKGVITDEHRAQIEDELGDILWYINAVASEIGSSLAKVAVRNNQKLEDRARRGAIRGSGDTR